MTEAEKIIWSRLRRRQVRGLRFLRQYSVDCFVLDFYSPQIKLAIEIDGVTHSSKEEIEYDYERQKHIELFGIKIVRYRNEEVYSNINKVIGKLEEEVDCILKYANLNS